VTAEVTYAGRKLQVDPAWIVVAPPNYAPLQKSVRTMWDLIRDVAITAKTLPKLARPSFERDIRPIFERLSRLQWVNAGFAAGFGWGAPSDFANPDWLEKLSRNSADTAEMRHVIANQFRVFNRDSWSRAHMSPGGWNSELLRRILGRGCLAAHPCHTNL
jgi:hypothetical protein